MKSLNSGILFQFTKSWKKGAVPSSGVYDLSLSLGFFINLSTPILSLSNHSLKIPLQRTTPFLEKSLINLLSINSIPLFHCF